MLKYLFFISFCILHELILSADLNVYPKIIERNDNHKGEFQAYVSGMDEIIQMTLQSGNDIINVNFEKIIFSNCEIFEFEKECIQSLLGCQWSSNKCSSATQCDQLSSTVCEKSSNTLKDKCEWDSSNKKCKNKKLCMEFNDSTNCTNNDLGCQWYYEKCIDYFSCNQFGFPLCEDTRGKFKDKCEWYIFSSERKSCISKPTSAQNCTENMNQLDCQRSFIGCRWTQNACIKAEHCNELTDYPACLNNNGALKDKCEWFTASSSSRYCRDKSKVNYIDNCKNMTYDDCQKGLNGCYWISDKCILPTQCSDFSQAICQNINSYSSFRGKCEWNESTKKCQRKANLYGRCGENLDENDCSRSLLGCTWVNNECVDAHQCSLLSSSACEYILSNTELRNKCEWNEGTKKCQRKANLYGICNEILDENDCSRSLLGCVWVNNTCVIAHQCSLLSSSACENVLSNTKLRNTCEWNKNDKLCLQKKSIRLIRNLVDDEIITKYKCSFDFPNIEENKNFDLILVDKNNNKASLSLSLIYSDSSNETSDDNEFTIYRSSGSFLKNYLFVSFILILLLFMIKN